jgi:DNA helicase-2/ATP-dependent DNA helicase PcrA
MAAVPDHLVGLNPPQMEAVTTVDGPLLILAGAGSGKTRVLTRRVAHLLYTGVAPWNLLAVTFTNKAAKEMRARVGEWAGDRADRLWVSTFHSACARLLRIEADAAGYTRQFVIYDDDDQMRLLRHILDDLGIDKKREPPQKFRRRIDRAKNALKTLDEITAESPPASRLPKVYVEYERRLKAANAMDFNDLINVVVRLFQDKPDVLARWQDRFRYLLVDEYQDTNRAQYELIRLLASAHRNLAVVGDDEQSIYSFRGADIQNILDFERDWPDAKVVLLEQNYRSTGHILSAAGAVVRHNRGRREKTLWTAAEKGNRIQEIVGHSQEHEAQQIVEAIHRHRAAGVSANEIALIYRTNAHSRPLEQALQRSRLSYVVVGARRFYERREVKDILAYLRLVVNPSDDMALLRVINVPRRGQGAKAIQRIRDHARDKGIPLLSAAQDLGDNRTKVGRSLKSFTDAISGWQEVLLHCEPGQLVQRIAEESGYVEMLQTEETEEALSRLQNIDELCRDVATAGPGAEESDHPLDQVQAFLDRVSLAGQADDLPDGEGHITLMTAHLAKGLEYDVVFVVGMGEGSFPHSRASMAQTDLEEERRLAYVAFTRAKKNLVLCRPRSRRLYGGAPEPVAPSRFLKEIPPEDFIRAKGGGLSPGATLPADARARLDSFLEKHGDSSRAAPATKQEIQVVLEPESASSFVRGARVLHPQFGEGEIKTVSGSPTNPKLVVHFREAGRKTLLARYANLELLLG